MTYVGNPAAATQVAALPYRRNETGDLSVLLVTSRTRRRWIIPKGKVPSGMLPSRAAEREAFEEAGVLGRIEKQPLTSYWQGGDGGLLGKPFLVQAFAMEVRDELSAWLEMRHRERRWFSVDDAVRMVRNREIRRTLRLFAQIHRN
jgi:8-oxo-dGTP pyrophosphatase MutT (NUDIX family)